MTAAETVLKSFRNYFGDIEHVENILALLQQASEIITQRRSIAKSVGCFQLRCLFVCVCVCLSTR